MRAPLSKEISLLIFYPFIAVIPIPTMCNTEYENTSGVEETPPDRNPYYDTDGDGISNAVELNGANAHLSFDTTVQDPNPSLARGLPNHGSLDQGLNLVDWGEGYYHYYAWYEEVDSDDWGVLHSINMVEGTGRRWYISRWWSGARLGVGDLSLQNGGYWEDHSSHQNGLDVDMRYMRTDGRELPLDISGPDSTLFHVRATEDIINLLLAYASIDVIYVDTIHSDLEVIAPHKIRHWPGHSNHFHVRIVDPDGTGN